jgi:hypothetical protein
MCVERLVKLRPTGRRNRLDALDLDAFWRSLLRRLKISDREPDGLVQESLLHKVVRRGRNAFSPCAADLGSLEIAGEAERGRKGLVAPIGENAAVVVGHANELRSQHARKRAQHRERAALPLVEASPRVARGLPSPIVWDRQTLALDRNARRPDEALDDRQKRAPLVWMHSDDPNQGAICVSAPEANRSAWLRQFRQVEQQHPGRDVRAAERTARELRHPTVALALPPQHLVLRRVRRPHGCGRRDG